SGHFENILKQVIKNADRKISGLNLITASEEQELLFEFNNRETAYPKSKTIVDLFEVEVSKNPGNTAIVFEGEKVSYQQLNTRSNQLANYLKKKKVAEGSMIPISVERGPDMMIGILGILKAGCAYVPVDPEYPEDRIKFMLKDTAANILISSSASIKKLADFSEIETIELDTDWETINHESPENVEANISPESLAYVIYTSGSTGRPKGVLVTHQNVVSLVKGTDYVSFSDKNILLSTGSSSFDATTFEYWEMLLNGGKLVLCAESKLLDNVLLKNEIQSRKVNMMWFTSSWFNQLVETDITLFKTLQTILVGGEKLSQQHIAKFKEAYPSIEIINGYGPTENTTFSLTYNIKDTSEDTSIPIGRPLNNRSAYVLDEDQKLVPVGVAGEIYLGGAGVAKGYLNLEKLTEERFIASPLGENPFTETDPPKLYKTGDLGRWLPDGNIEYLGRIDSQVKIRGYRIELEEIEAVLLQAGLVKQAVVIAKEDTDGDKKLVAYVVVKDVFDKEEITSYLNSKLPDYMVPAFIVELEKIPLTSNGKVDKRALPDPEINISSGPSAEPGNELEEKLTKVWLDVLKIDSIGTNDDFFDMGGHSLLAIRLMSVLRKELGLEINIGDIFEYPTIATLAAYLNNQSAETSIPPIKAGPRPEYIPLSFSQERLWFIDQLEGSVQYHIPALFRIKGNLNLDALAKSIQAIINRHEVLRTTFRKKDGSTYQYIKERDQWELKVLEEFTGVGDNDQLRNRIQQLIKEPFDLSNNYMLRATLITLQNSEYLLLVTMHHIASDGWSMPIIVREIASLYNGYDNGQPVELAPLEIQYADYAIWQRNYLQGEVLEKKIDYWKNKLEGVAVLELPTDYKRPSVHGTQGGNRGLNISKELADRLNSLSRDEGVTLFMVLLAAFKILLQRYSGQEDICVGIPIANRAQQEVNELVGFFVNTLALRSNVKARVSFKEFLQQVKATTMEAYEHQDVPFEKVVEAVVKERDLSRSP
ncbi:MAG: amino acid adenylation domain-containing protein, partial [Bacteroidota bacterium]|nr:amino acid adenylation domain-containing protein [Bacteroidota bacterium]